MIKVPFIPLILTHYWVLLLGILVSLPLVGCAPKTMSWSESQQIFGEQINSRYQPGSLRNAVLNKVGNPTTTFQRTQSGWPPTMPKTTLKSVNYAETTFAFSAQRVDVYAVFGTDLEGNRASMRPYDDLLFYDENDELRLVHRQDR